MNEEAQKIFDKLVTLSVSELTPEDRGFLKARRTYMNDEQKRIYATVIADVEPQGDSFPAEKDTKKK